MANGIAISCKRKKELFILARTNNDKKIKDYYLKYSKILSKSIKTAKMLYYKNRITHAHNKTKTTWKIINEDMGINSGKMKERGEKINKEIQSLIKLMLKATMNIL
jgi:hypothetical protein